MSRILTRPPATPAGSIERRMWTSRARPTRAAATTSGAPVPGEWLEVSVTVASAGTYALDVRVANIGTGARFRIEIDGIDRTGPMNVPNTGGWQIWQTVSDDRALAFSRRARDPAGVRRRHGGERRRGELQLVAVRVELRAAGGRRKRKRG